MTLAIDEDKSRAEQRLDAFLEKYYGQPAAVMRQRQACNAGPAAAAGQFLAGFVEAGAGHLVVRFVGDHERQLDVFTRLRSQFGW